jgi:hypothetical protein
MDCTFWLISEFVGGEDIGTGWSEDLGPSLAGVKRGLKLRDVVLFICGPSGVEFTREDEAGPSRTAEKLQARVRGQDAKM